MHVSEILESSLVYGDRVRTKDPESKLANIVGKITEISGVTAAVRFDNTKKPVRIMLSALEKI